MAGKADSLGLTSFRYLDEGGFAKVYRAIHSRTGTPVVVKRLIASDGRSQEVLRKESKTQRQLDHPFIVHCYGVRQGADGVETLCDFVNGRSLLQEVNARSGLHEDTVRQYTTQLLCALRYLHEDRSIAHRDIKLENVMVEREGFIRLIDFGFSRAVDPEMSTRCGSLPYAAPELIRGKKYGSGIDLWSLGVVVYAMLSGRLPFSSSSTTELMRQICTETPAQFSGGRGISESAQSFVNGLLTKEPDRRLTILGATDHPFIKSSENAWLLHEAVLEQPAYRVFSGRDPDPAIVAELVKRGYDERKVVINRGDEVTTEESFAYELLKTQQIRKSLVDLVNDRSAAEQARQKARMSRSITAGFKPLTEPLSPGVPEKKSDQMLALPRRRRAAPARA